MATSAIAVLVASDRRRPGLTSSTGGKGMTAFTQLGSSVASSMGTDPATGSRWRRRLAEATTRRPGRRCSRSRRTTRPAPANSGGRFHARAQARRCARLGRKQKSRRRAHGSVAAAGGRTVLVRSQRDPFGAAPAIAGEAGAVLLSRKAQLPAAGAVAPVGGGEGEEECLVLAGSARSTFLHGLAGLIGHYRFMAVRACRLM
jgi:hypothetical protein